MLYPAWLPPDQDSFPLSTYPMFSQARPRSASVTSALAVGSDGSERAVPPSFVANAETMQALQTLRNAVSGGPEQARALCAAIARRLSESGDADFSAAAAVVLVTQTVDSIRYLAGEHAVQKRVLHARCPVRRGQP